MKLLKVTNSCYLNEEAIVGFELKSDMDTHTGKAIPLTLVHLVSGKTLEFAGEVAQHVATVLKGVDGWM